MLRKLLALAALIGLVGAAAPALAATTQQPLREQSWSFNGAFGMYDQAQLQRGFKVYQQVCSQCHSINYITFHNLGDPGGPFWSPKYPNSNDNPYVKALAASWPRQVPDINADTGDPTHRPATTADVLPAPFPNDAAARASNGGALPPDMSLLVAAREGGPRYVYSIASWTGAAPAGLTPPPGKYYNPYFAGDVSSNWKGDPNHVPVGGFIGMPPPLTNCKVTFDDKTPCTVDQEARDVAAFLTWASDPKMEQRKQMGIGVLAFLAILSLLTYLSYRQIWRGVAH
ncbi:MAG TPA: cytochrome c1 [Caulobacteraceae bacterium]|jgi:ubiquinol-cytochrome c reductase cytochrome c1 subunit